MSKPVRDRGQRKADTLSRLENDVDAWVATAGTNGPWLVALTFQWDGSTLLFAIGPKGPTAGNIGTEPQVRVALGHTRDVVMIHGTAELATVDEVAPERLDAFAAKEGSDPRGWASTFVIVTPVRIDAWREVDEQRGRVLMRNGTWSI